MNRRLFWLIIILIVGNLFFGWRAWSASRAERQAAALVERSRLNIQTLEFTRLFVGKVLRTDGEVDFETRLDLENKVRALGNKEILDSWQKFLNSQTEAEAQENVKDLLTVLLARVY